jgi:hypothetical protein
LSIHFQPVSWAGFRKVTKRPGTLFFTRDGNVTVLHSGTSKQYSDNWAAAFGKAKKTTAAAAKKAESSGTSTKKAAKKATKPAASPKMKAAVK